MADNEIQDVPEPEDEFDETAFIDDTLVENDEPMSSDNSVTDPNPTQIQDEEV